MTIGLKRRSRSAPQFLEADPAARLDHAGGLQILQVDQDPGRQAVEVAGPVRLVGQYPGQAQGFHADVDAVADLEVQRSQQARFDPGVSGRGTAAGLFDPIGGWGTLELPPQGVGFVDGLDAGELDRIVGGNDAGELDYPRMIQPQFQAAVELFRACWGAAFQQQIGAEELGGA